MLGMNWKMIMKCFVLLIFISSVTCLKLEAVNVPTIAPKDTHARLQCKYRLDPGEILYSVKWYKDGSEFFRYIPRDAPPAQAFPLPGVDIDEVNSTETTVYIGPLSFESSGKYRCEVSGEAPLFQTVSQHKDLLVVYIPNDGPKIAGGKLRYHINDMVRLNCSSGKSRPAAALTWHVNGEQVDPLFLVGPYVEDAGGLFITSMALEFRVLPKHFKSGDMKLKCVATIASMYNRTREESIEGERPLRAPALESRDSALAGDTRTDRVQAAGVSSFEINYYLFLPHLIYTIVSAIKKVIR